MIKLLNGSLLAFLAAFVVLPAPGNLQAGESKRIGPDPVQWLKVRTRAINFLKSAQDDDGSWTSPQATGLTALATTALLESGIPASDPVVSRSLKYLESLVQKDGGIYHPRTLHRNYETSIAMLAFHVAARTARPPNRFAKHVKAARDFLKHLQWDKGEGLETTDPGFGGAGYGKHQRPDLSNTQFFQEALRSAGVKKDDPAMKNVLIFVSRCQNLESENNTTPFAGKIGDGGFYYTPAAGGTSQAGLAANGGLRSYGSMTYAGLKSMIYAGVDRKDPRVQAALTWIRRNYTTRLNPGLGQQGLYYYYHTFAKSLSVLDVGLLEDSAGVKHDWRSELFDQLRKLQKPNGSWVNRAPRWYEGDPNLSTAYVLLALRYCRSRPLKTKPSKGKPE
ncbi:MAG: terpene cyclase/mutase family protein [Planctomycetaceae bacterium]|mgnify:CR=1 FL=1|jgi:squalene-hopene/tetraprenyl-beta-curcumene cyclase|nr:terpene cyclase/mutase family protein [Planctomycetaceae bacterium]